MHLSKMLHGGFVLTAAVFLVNTVSVSQQSELLLLAGPFHRLTEHDNNVPALQEAPADLLPTLLRFLHRVVGVLQQLGDDRLDVFTHVAGLS